MKKYKIFRSFVSVDKDIQKHELVAIENGDNIDTATNLLIKAICDDAIGLPKYQKAILRLLTRLKNQVVFERLNAIRI